MTKKNDDVMDQGSWADELDKVVKRLNKINDERDHLLSQRQLLVTVGITNGWDTRVGVAERIGLSRGRVQQLVNNL